MVLNGQWIDMSLPKYRINSCGTVAYSVNMNKIYNTELP